MLKNLPTGFSKWVATDETTFELDHRRQEFVWRPKGPADFSHGPQSLARKTNTWKPKLIVWGAIWSSGFRILVRILFSLDGPAYQALLNETLLPI